MRAGFFVMEEISFSPDGKIIEHKSVKGLRKYYLIILAHIYYFFFKLQKK